MTNTRGRDPSNTDSTHDLLAGWNIEEVDESIANPASSEPQNSRGEVHRVDPSSRSSPWNARAHPSRRDLDAFPGFVLGESRAEVSTGLKDSLGEGLNRTTRKKPGVVRGTETVRGRKPGAVRDTPPPSSRSSGPGRFPHPGDLLAGFQILQELGRVRLPASTWPKRSTWDADWSPSRSRDRRARSRRSSPGSSTRTSCQSTRSATIRRPACEYCACRISAVPTWPRSSTRQAASTRPSTTVRVLLTPSTC